MPTVIYNLHMNTADRMATKREMRKRRSEPHRHSPKHAEMTTRREGSLVEKSSNAPVLNAAFLEKSGLRLDAPHSPSVPAGVPGNSWQSLRTAQDSAKRGVLPPRFTLVEHGALRFLLSDAPRADELASFKSTWKKFGVNTVVHACAPGYDVERLKTDFDVLDLAYDDGSVPTEVILNEWLKRVDKMEKANREHDSGHVIAVHCKTGLGRAPLLVAVALIENGMSALEAVGFIRSLRRGAINVKQLQFLEEYVRRADRASSHHSPSLMQRARSALLSRNASQNGAAQNQQQAVGVAAGRKK